MRNKQRFGDGANRLQRKHPYVIMDAETSLNYKFGGLHNVEGIGKLITSEGLHFVVESLEFYYRKSSNLLVAKEPPYHPEDGGVPPEMRDGQVNEDGWVQWKMFASTVSETDVLAIEHEYGITFPPLFRAYLIARFHLFDQIKNERHLLLLPAIPSDNPFGPLRAELDAWPPLLQAEYIPFGEYEDSWGPICFDTLRRDESGDCQVVWFDHEELLSSLDEERMVDRSIVEKYAKDLYASFRELMADMFLQSCSQ